MKRLVEGFWHPWLFYMTEKRRGLVGSEILNPSNNHNFNLSQCGAIREGNVYQTQQELGHLLPLHFFSPSYYLSLLPNK